MTVDGVPNVRVCVEPLRDGRGRPRAERARLARPRPARRRRPRRRPVHAGRLLLPHDDPAAARCGRVYERVLRTARRPRPRRRARRGPRPLRHRASPRRRARRRRRALRARGGRRRRPRPAARVAARRRAAAASAASGRTTCSRPRARSAIYEGGLVPVDAGAVLHRIRAGPDRRRDRRDRAAARVPRQRPRRRDAARRPSSGSSTSGRSSPGRRAVVIGADERALAGVTGQLERAGVDLAAVVDLRDGAPARIAASGRGGAVGPVTLDGRAIDCDLLVASGGRQPAYSLLAQAGARVEYDAAPRASSSRSTLPSGRRGGRAARPATGRAGRSRPRRTPARAASAASSASCEDVTDEGREARGRGGLRLDRAREALHDRDDGPVPGEALPPRLDPAAGAGDGDGRGGDRDDHRAAAVGARRARRCSPGATTSR